MFKTVLAPLFGDDGDHRTLEASYLTVLGSRGHVEALHVQPAPSLILADIALRDMMSPETIDAVRQNAAVSRQEARRHFEEFCSHLGLEKRNAPLCNIKVTAALQDLEGDQGELFTHTARFHDLTVCIRNGTAWPGARSPLEAVLFDSGRPILIAPEKPIARLDGTVVVAWKSTPEAARAVTAAMPLLISAQRVVVYAADEDDGRGSCAAAIKAAERVTDQLRSHGVDAEARLIVPGGRSIAVALVESARFEGADLLVTGGYGHGRMRERLLGGVTRDLLAECPLPLLVCH